MTSFEAPGGDFDPGQSRMHTELLADTGRALTGIADIEDTSVTEAVRAVVSIHRWYTMRAAGSLLIAGGTDVVEIKPPAIEVPRPARIVSLCIIVNNEVREYIEDQVKPSDDPSATLAFWASAIGFYGSIRERQLLGCRFGLITPPLDLRKAHFPGRFETYPAEPEGMLARWRQLLRRDT